MTHQANISANMPLLIKHLLHTSRAYALQQEIVYRDQLRYTYATLHERIARLASGLASQGVQFGDTVAVMDWDSHRYLECFFAVPMMGATLQTVNVRLSPEQIRYTLNQAQPGWLLVHNDFIPLLLPLLPTLQRPPRLILLSDDPDISRAGLPPMEDYEALLSAAEACYDFPEFDEQTRATLFFTTGTTGAPKGVYFSHRQLVLHTLAGAAALGMAAGQGRFHNADVYMPITPMFHVHAWGLPYMATMAGVKQVYPGRYAPETLLALIAREGVTFSHCVPTILHMLLEHPDSQQVALDRWKVIIGGSALPKALAEAALARGIDVFAGYGLSETCPVLTLGQLRPDEDDQGATYRIKAGLPIPLVELKVVDNEMNELPHDGVSTGEVVTRTPWLTEGYLHDEAGSRQLWEGGYLHTGDVGRIGPDGYLSITDRIKDVIKSGGEWISSLLLEDLLLRHPAVRAVSVIGIPDTRWGERPLALVVLKENVTCEAEMLRQHLQQFVEQGELSRFGMPEHFKFIDELPKTSVGKLDKRAMRQRWAEG